MRWFSHAMAWVLLVGLIALAPALREALPNTAEGMAAEAYKQWAGVLRIWVCMGWQPGNGSIVPWLNEVAGRFERAHPGVYVQVTPVSEAQMAHFASSALNPPDAVVFSPGLLAGADGLMAIEGDLPVSAPLADAGAVGGERFAMPVAMGGYAWAVNVQLLDGLPLWDAELPAPTPKGERAFVMQAPADGAHVSWSGALTALCLAAPEAERHASEGAPVGDGIDLGLEAEPEAPAKPETEAPIGNAVFTCPSRLPLNFRADSAVVGDFAARRAAAIPVSQVEIKQLENLADTGRAPDYEIMPGLGAYTDQLALFGIAAPGEQPTPQQSLCRLLLAMLLDERSQAGLSAIRALKVADGAAAYSSNRSMSALERGYAGREIECPGAFDSTYTNRKKLELDSALSRRRG